MGGNLGREAVREACWRKCVVFCRNKGNQVVRIEKEKRSHWPSTNWAQIQIKQKKLRGRTKPEPFSLSCCCPDLRLLSRLRETIPGRVRSYEVKSSSCFLSEKREDGILTYLKPFSRSRVDGICTNSEQERQFFVQFQQSLRGPYRCRLRGPILRSESVNDIWLYYSSLIEDFRLASRLPGPSYWHCQGVICYPFGGLWLMNLNEGHGTFLFLPLAQLG